MLALDERRGRLTTILATLGSVLVGLGVIVFFAANWQEIPRAPKLALILIAIASAYGIGYWLKYRWGRERVGSAVIFLGAVFFGVGIHLVAQLYNVSLNDPKLFLYWFLGVIPLAYLTRSQAIMFLAVGLFLSAVGFWLWQWLDHESTSVIVAFSLFLVLGLLLYRLGRLQALVERTRPYAAAYDILGLLTVFGALYLLTFREWYDDFRYHGAGFVKDFVLVGDFWWLLHTGAALTLLALVAGAAWRLTQRRPWQTLPYEASASLVLLVAAYLSIYLAVRDDVFYPILFNALLFLGIVGVLFVGYIQGQERLINIALVFFGLDVVSRYFEFSWALLDRSLVFVVAGLLLLVGAFVLERGRRTVFERIRVRQVHDGTQV